MLKLSLYLLKLFFFVLLQILMNASPIMEAVIISVKTLLAVLIAAAEKDLNY